MGGEGEAPGTLVRSTFRSASWRFPMTTNRQAHPTDIAMARGALLALHGALLAEARIAHEREHGRLSNAAFLQVAAHDPAFAWLGVLLRLVVRLDTEEDRAPVLAEAASLLRCEGGGEFA